MNLMSNISHCVECGKQNEHHIVQNHDESRREWKITRQTML